MHSEADTSAHVFLLLVSALILLGVLVRVISHRLMRMPPAVGYIGLGLGMRIIDARVPLLSEQTDWGLYFLGEIGVACLLFQVGLRSDTRSLEAQLPAAVWVWLWNFAIAAGCGFAATLLLGFDLVPALFVAVAMSATSVGISVSVWSDMGRLRSKLGALLVDVAELDDLSAVICMLAVTATAQALQAGEGMEAALGTATSATLWLLVKVALFAVGCFLFARYLEQPLTRVLSRAQRPPERVLTLVGVAFGTASIAASIGLSAAVGALFAGLMFSRDPRAVHQDASFGPIYALFTPFFFIYIGFGIDPAALSEAAWLGAVLAVPAVLGKVVGGGLPLVKHWGGPTALIFGLSMVPRAEIALLIVHAGQRLGTWAIPPELYAAMVVTCALTATLAPMALATLMRRYPDVGRWEHGRLPTPATSEGGAG